MRPMVSRLIQSTPLKPMDWHLITGEYPPQRGGVSDYSHLVATGLAAEGDIVHVWCPSSKGEQPDEIGVVVHRALGNIGAADLHRVGRRLDQFPAPRRLLVQWVPQGYGYRSMNLPFCFWLWQRAKFKRDHVDIIVHEPFLAFGEGSMKQNIAAAVHRVMVTILLNAAIRVWVSIPNWEIQLRPFALGRNKSFAWLPVPSNIPVIEHSVGITNVRAKYALPDELLVGHFGAYDLYMMELMLELLPSLLSVDNKLSVMLLGIGSVELRDRLIERHPDLQDCVYATGTLSAENISLHISACDVMLQPYQDGVSGRRTSVMTALSHGIPVVTNIGKATETCWVESQAVELTKVRDIRAMVEATRSLLADEERRSSMSEFAVRLYRERFDLQHIISALRPTGVSQSGESRVLSSHLLDN